MEYAAICSVAVAASALTFFSGFGLGTLLMPAFAFFYPIEVAVASTAVVHFLNGLFKLTLVGRHADRSTTWRFGLPAMLAAVAGAWVLVQLSDSGPIATWSVGGFEGRVIPAKLIVGFILLGTTILELSPGTARMSVPRQYLPVGGLISGFLGGVAGVQGALRAAFLIRLGLSKETFIATGVVVAVMVDVSRLGVYARGLLTSHDALNYPLLSAAVLSAFAGAFLGNQFLKKVTLHAVQRIVAVMLIGLGIALVAGVL